MRIDDQPHVHLLLTPARKDSASLLMKHLGQRYVQYVNRHYRRSGTLWEGRFCSCLAQREEYVLTCYRYLYPGMKVIALSMHAEDRFVAAMRGAGAAGYVLKDKVAEELAAASRAVAGGQTYFRLQALDDSV